MDLTKLTLLREADDLFDIDKEVDAQIKRVENRIARKDNQEQPPQEDNPENDQPENINNEEPPEDNTAPENEPVENQDQEDPNLNNDTNQQTPGDGQSQGGDYEYMDNGSQTEDIPEDYEPKQTIPELKILNTLSDSEYALCNIRILEDFKELRKNVDSTINNILMTITTKNARQRQIINIVHSNLLEMMEDIDNYIVYRNNDVYEENVVAYLTYLKRYRIATNLIKLIVDENLKADKDTK